MATTTNQADELLWQPVPLHLCDDVLDRDLDDLDASDVIDLDLSGDNVRSHAEVPAPDGFGLPSHDCWVYQATAPANVRETVIDTITIASTSLSEVQYDALATAARLEEAGARVLPLGAPRSRGMGRELDVRFVRARPELRGQWHRHVPLTGWTRLVTATETRTRIEALLEELSRGAA